MRHKDMTTTLRIYTQVLEHSREGVGERLDHAIWGFGMPQGTREDALGPLYNRNPGGQ